jgi:hypothetical protein
LTLLLHGKCIFIELGVYAMFLFPFVDVSFLHRYTVNLVVFFVDKKLTGEKESTPMSRVIISYVVPYITNA